MVWLMVVVITILLCINVLRDKKKISISNKQIQSLRDSLARNEKEIDSLLNEQVKKDTIIRTKIVKVRTLGKVLLNINKPIKIDSIADKKELDKIKLQILNDSI